MSFLTVLRWVFGVLSVACAARGFMIGMRATRAARLASHAPRDELLDAAKVIGPQGPFVQQLERQALESAMATRQMTWWALASAVFSGFATLVGG
jgi:hypothetical protein